MYIWGRLGREVEAIELLVCLSMPGFGGNNNAHHILIHQRLGAKSASGSPGKKSNINSDGFPTSCWDAHSGSGRYNLHTTELL
jgi:hypothetical protein